jgi:hypothetical protein
MRDLLLFLGASFTLALLGVWAWFDVPAALIVSALPFVVVLPVAGALVCGALAPRLERPRDPTPEPPDKAV